MNKTAIEWVKNPDGTQGYTWNPVTGCLNHINGTCKGGNFPCYAYRLAHGRLRYRYLANRNVPSEHFNSDNPEARVVRSWAEVDPFYPRFWAPHRMLEPRDSTRGKGIFVCDMGDLFGIGVPDEWTKEVLREIRICHDNRFYLLTKQPQNLIKWSPFPENCWVGVTATDTRMALEACLKLGDIEASIRYLSIEPMLNPINLPPEFMTTCKLGWLIIGALTGTYAEMFDTSRRLYGGAPMRITKLGGAKYALQLKIEWIQEIVEAADKAGIPVFLKNNILGDTTFLNLPFRQEVPL